MLRAHVEDIQHDQSMKRTNTGDIAGGVNRMSWVHRIVNRVLASV